MSDWTRPDPDRSAPTGHGPHGGQVVFGSSDDYSALGGHQNPPGTDRHGQAAWTSGAHPPHPAPPQPAPAPAAPPSRSRTPLVVGIAAGAVIVIGAFIAGGLLVPRWLAGSTAGPSPDAPSQSQEAGTTVEDAPEFAVDLSGTWDGSTGTGATKVNFVVTLVDDGATLTGSIDYTEFGCTSSLTQTGRDAASVTLHEKIESGPCSTSVDTIIIDVPGEGATSASFSAGPRSGVITRR